MTTKGMEADFFSRSPSREIMAVLCSLFWGLAYPMLKIGMEQFSAIDTPSKLVFAGIRFILAGLTMIVYFTIRERKFAVPQNVSVKKLLLVGIEYTTLQYTFFYIGISKTAGIVSAILGSASAFLYVIMAHFAFDDDRLSRKKVYGCMIGITGILVCNMGAGVEQSSITGGICLLLAAGTCCVGGIWCKKLAVIDSPSIIVSWNLFCGGGVLLVLGLIFGGRVYIQSLSAVAVFAVLIVIAIITLVLWTPLLRYNNVGEISIFNLLTPVFGSVLSALFLHERFFEPKIIAALVLVCLGIYEVNRGISVKRV